jgi:hypothetical protein
LALVAGALVANPPMVSAVHSEGVNDNGLFELGPVGSTPTNILGGDAAGPDWADLFNGSGQVIPGAVDNFGGEAATFIADDRSVAGAVDRTVYAGSNKNNDAINTWNWASGNAPVKDDLSNVYAYAVKNTDGDLILYFGGERLSANGDSHIDFEFNQEEIALDKPTPLGQTAPTCGSDQSAGPADGSPCEFSGAKSEGDLIISLDYTKGGDLGSFEVRKFTNGTYTAVVTEPGPGCNDAFNDTAEDAICGFTNGAPINGGPWPNFDSHNALIAELPANAFAEFGINVTEALDETPCFATFGAHTRTSQSFTSELKDFAVGSFQVCQPDTALTASATVTFTFYEKNTGSAPLTKPGNFDFVKQSTALGTTACDSFGQVRVNPNDPASRNIGDNSSANGAVIGNGVLDPDETWQYFCTKNIGSSSTTTASSLTIATGHGIFNGTDTTFCSDDDPATAYEVATVSQGGANATPNCDQDEQPWRALVSRQSRLAPPRGWG